MTKPKIIGGKPGNEKRKDRNPPDEKMYNNLRNATTVIILIFEYNRKRESEKVISFTHI